MCGFTAYVNQRWEAGERRAGKRQAGGGSKCFAPGPALVALRRYSSERSLVAERTRQKHSGLESRQGLSDESGGLIPHEGGSGFGEVNVVLVEIAMLAHQGV